MSRLPVKGEVAEALAAMNERMRAMGVAEHGTTDYGPVDTNLVSGESRGEGMGPALMMYGDLFDVGEMVAGCAVLCEKFIVDIAVEEQDPMSALVSLFLLGAGAGVMLERRRGQLRQGREFPGRTSFPAPEDEQ